MKILYNDFSLLRYTNYTRTENSRALIYDFSLKLSVMLKENLSRHDFNFEVFRTFFAG